MQNVRRGSGKTQDYQEIVTPEILASQPEMQTRGAANRGHYVYRLTPERRARISRVYELYVRHHPPYVIAERLEISLSQVYADIREARAAVEEHFRASILQVHTDLAEARRANLATINEVIDSVRRPLLEPEQRRTEAGELVAAQSGVPVPLDMIRGKVLADLYRVHHLNLAAYESLMLNRMGPTGPAPGPPPGIPDELQPEIVIDLRRQTDGSYSDTPLRGVEDVEVAGEAPDVFGDEPDDDGSDGEE